jgi:hypothetical protein
MREIQLLEYYGKGNFDEALEILQKYNRIADINLWEDMRVLNPDGTVRHKKAGTRVFISLENISGISDLARNLYEVYKCKINEPALKKNDCLGSVDKNVIKFG